IETPLMTPTATPTRTQTATPTETCVVQELDLGMTAGALAADDCRRSIRDSVRFADVYTVSATPGQALTIAVQPNQPNSFMPLVRVTDPSQVRLAEGEPPIQFVITSAQPYEVMVTSDPGAAAMLGDYTLTVSSTPCPDPVAIPLPGARLGNLTPT